MELKIVEEGGVKKLDTSVAQGNVEKYSVEKRGLESALERTNFELGNAECILQVMEGLSKCALDHQGDNEWYFFLTQDGCPAVPAELVPGGDLPPELVARDFRIVPMEDLKKVQCPGCPKIRTCIGRQSTSGFGYKELVICGNSLYTIRVEFGKLFFNPS